jgi:hypothetical protein
LGLGLGLGRVGGTCLGSGGGGGGGGGGLKSVNGSIGGFREGAKQLTAYPLFQCMVVFVSLRGLVRAVPE